MSDAAPMSDGAPATHAPDRHHHAGPEDRVLPYTRVVAYVIIPVLVAAAFLLLVLPGLVNVWMLWDDRWSAFRHVFQAQLASLACILIAIVVRIGDFQWQRPSAWLFVGGIVLSAVVYVVFYASLERARRGNVRR